MEDNINFDYKNLSPFKWFVLENFPFIEADFDALTEWQLFCKLGKEINKIIDSQNIVGEQAETLTNAFNTLKNYVDNYFNNLDVQDEINNKLNEMVEDGTISNIINKEVFSDINNRILQNSENIGTLNQQMGNTVKINQANSITSNMLTQEVKEQITGGSTAVVGVNAISNENIQNNAITILNLDDNLKENYLKEYENVNYNTNLQGFCRIVGGNLDIVTNDTEYAYGTVPLIKDSIYEYGYKNIGQLIAIIVVDSTDSNKIVYSTDDGLTKGTRNVNIKFRVNKAGLIAYISKRNAGNYFEDNATLFTKINNLSLNYTKDNNINLLKTLNDKYLRRLSQVGSIPSLVDTTSPTVSNVKIYKICKGVKYICHGANYVEIAGLMILNESGLISYTSSTEQVRPLTYFDYEFVASDDGFVCLQDYNDSNGNVIASSINVDNNFRTKEYINKNWVAIGDSLTDFATLGTSVKNYVNYVQDKLGINAINFGKGGTGWWRGHTNNNAFYNRALTVPNSTDIITIFGSFNDLGIENDVDGKTIIGDITDTGTNTLCGCINTTLANIFATSPNALVGVVSPTPWQTYNKNNEYAIEYVTKMKQICELNSIPFLDLFTNSNLRPWDATFRGTFYNNADGVHPNSQGHKRFSNEFVEFIKKILY